jgi:hypothetical protein
VNTPHNSIFSSTMDPSWCKDIYTSTEQNSSWKTSIFFNTSLFTVYNLTGIESSVYKNNESINHDNIQEMEIEANTEVDIAQATKADDEADIETILNNVTSQTTPNEQNTTSQTIQNQEDSTQQEEQVLNANKYLKPNSNHEVDILLFLNPSLLIQSQINNIWRKNKYPDNCCFLFEGYYSFKDKEKLVSVIRSKAINDITSLTVHSKN